MDQLIPDRNKIVLDQIREIVDPGDQMTDAELLQRIEKVFVTYFKNRDATRKRVKRHRARKKAEQANSS